MMVDIPYMDLMIRHQMMVDIPYMTWIKWSGTTVSNLQPPTKMEGPQHRSLIPTWESPTHKWGGFRLNGLRSQKVNIRWTDSTQNLHITIQQITKSYKIFIKHPHTLGFWSLSMICWRPVTDDRVQNCTQGEMHIWLSFSFQFPSFFGCYVRR